MEQDEQPRQELVKCVLVGDNAVGKTRLTCARATRQHCSLSQLLNPHQLVYILMDVINLMRTTSKYVIQCIIDHYSGLLNLSHILLIVL